MPIDKKKIIELEGKITQKKNELGMIGGIVRLYPMAEMYPNITGRLHPITYEAEIKVNTGWKPEERAGVKDYLQKKQIADPVECAVLDVTGHEVGHWRHCPHGLVQHLDILEAVAKEFEAAGKQARVDVPDQKTGKTKQEFGAEVGYMANAFEDLIVNANRRLEGDGNGITIFFRDQNTFTPFYEAFVKANMRAWGDEADQELLKRCYAPDAKKLLFFKRKSNEVDPVIDKMMSAFGCTDNLDRNAKILNDETRWEDLAKIFTRNMLPLYDKPPYQHNGDNSKDNGNGQGRSQNQKQQDSSGGQPQQEQQKEEKDKEGQGNDEKEQKEQKKDESKEGQGKDEKEEEKKDQEKKGKGRGKDRQKKDEKKEEEGKGRGKKDEKEADKDNKDGKGEENEGDEQGKGTQSKPWDGKQPPTGPGGNPFDDAMKDEDQLRKAMEEQVKQAIAAKGAKSAGGKKGAKAGAASKLDPQLYLDVLYEEMAPEIMVNAKAQDGKGWSYPIAPYGKEPFDPATHELNRIRLNKMMLNGDAEMVFAASKFKYPIDIKVREGIKKLPDICFIIDTSGSMIGGGDSDQIPWGDRSSYHYALMGVYGIVKWMRNTGIAPFIKYSAVNFSNSTISSGQSSFGDLRAFKDTLLSPQSGGTEIDLKVIKQEFEGRDKTLVVMLSDGEIANWGSVRKRFLTIMSKHQPVFIQIGGRTRTGMDFEKFGFPVYNVDNYEDLPKMMVDATAKTQSQTDILKDENGNPIPDDIEEEEEQ
jgi:hypothetical protein